MTRTTPTVLIVGAGLMQTYAMRAARARGLRVIATDANPDAVGLDVADLGYACNVFDVAGHQTLVRRLKYDHPLVGVTSCGMDAAPTIAHAAREAGTPGLDPAVATGTWHKDRVRQRLKDAGLDALQPAWHVVEFRPGVSPDPWPVDTVVKPTTSRASRGLSLVPPGSSLVSAVAEAARFSPVVLIEQRVQGSEHSCEMLIGTDGLPCYFNVVDRLFTYDRGMPLEIGHLNPSQLDEDAWFTLWDATRAAAQALGVTWGPFKVDVIWETAHARPVILEATARLSGGFDCQETTPRATGRDPIGATLELACGLPITAPLACPDVHPVAACHAVLPPAGRVAGLPDPARVAEWAGIEAVLLTAEPGDVIPARRHCAERSGYVIATAPTAARAWKRAERAARELAAAFSLEDTA
jgi:biotin carboxylase